MRRSVALLCGLLALVLGISPPAVASPLENGRPSRGGGPAGFDSELAFLLEQSAHEAGLEHEDQTKRQDVYLQTLRDGLGRVRPDLWQKGRAALDELPVSATWRKVKRVAGGLLGDPAAAGFAANTLVTGVRWRQIGPAPLRIDPTNTPAGGDTLWFQGDGPTSGEVTDIAIDPRGSTDRTVYVATNDGGIWKTTNGGISWTTTFDDISSLSMGAVAIDPVNRQIVYAGTGNGFDGGCLFTKGSGLYKSVDGGATWGQVGGTLFNNLMINRIRVLAGNVVLVGTNNGLYRSVDGGANFGANAPQFNNSTPILQGNATDIDIDTASPTTVYASMGVGERCGRAAPGGTSGVFVSTDGGATFPTNLFTNAGAPATASDYITFAQGTNISSRFYASVSQAGNAWDGLYRSNNSGTGWNRMAAADNPAANSFNGCQCGYDQILGVDPLDANRVYIGFQEVWLSTDGGTTFPNSTPTPQATGAVTYQEVHWDQHAIVFSPSTHVSSSATTTPVWLGHDGGVSRSSDGGTNWDNLNETIATNLFKEIDMGRGTAPRRQFTYGGAQDTGTMQRRPDYAATDWHEAIDGDGLSIAVDPANANHVLTTDNGFPFVTTDGGNSWTFLTVPGTGTIGLVRWDPTNNANVWAANSPGGQRGFLPGTQLMRSTDTGGTFNNVGAAFASRIGAIAIDPNNSANVWLGLFNGTVQRSTNGTAATPTFAATATQPGPNQRISDIAVDPADASGNTVVLTYEGFSGAAAGSPTQHVYRTIDGGGNWNDISGTTGTDVLPDLPTHSVVIDPGTTPSSIIVADDGGVLRTLDNGATWQILGTGLPTVDSESLAIDASATPPVLRVGTYGRSVFELVSSTGPVIDTKGDLAFGQLKKGKSEARVVQVFNVGTTDLTISSFTRTAGSAEFSVLSGPMTPATIPPGGHQDWSVKYAPTDVGADTATFTIASDDPNNASLALPASGEGVESLGGGDGEDDCAKRYVAGGDGVTIGTDIGNDSGGTSKDRYSDKLLNDRLKKITGAQTGDVWCLYNTSTDPATTDTFVQGANSQQAQAWNLRPDLITLTLGRQNNTIIDHVKKCFKNIKDHDFLDANTCALAVYANQPVWDKLKKDLGNILNKFKTLMSSKPNLVVAVTGYYNPYPSATDVATKIPQFCMKLQDTIPTCIARWVLLPPALVTLDLVVKKLNDTISPVVKQFAISSQGRFFFVNPYDKFKDHCMKIEVEIKTKVYHPTNTVHDHNSSKNFGCSDPFVVKDGTDGNKSPFPYLTPAVTGVLLLATQTTKEMGINPNKKGHDCISDLIWEAVKNKLGVPEKPDPGSVCS